jgi:outer membrane murein-binding lipoprotein Lpp
MKTKITFFIVTFIITSLVLAGCSSQAITAVAASSGLSMATKLATGTLTLQGTSNAITASEASQLLTLWQAYQSMSSSDTTSQVELEALVSQIQSSMTSEQIKAIDDMNLTEQSVSEVIQASAPSYSSTPSGTPSTSSNTNQSMPGGSSSASQGAPTVRLHRPGSRQDPCRAEIWQVDQVATVL